LASVPNAEQNCMPASNAPTLLQASGSSAPSLSRNASPTSALAMTARSFLSAPPWSEKRRRHQGAPTTRVAPSTISSRNSRSTTARRPPRRLNKKSFHLSPHQCEARKGKPVPSDQAPLVLDVDSHDCSFDAGLPSAKSRIAARRSQR
jgi:hypothetical protein